ncbi:orotate phosphoribosyltransferase [Salsipaludibacter albus]|uniref:orotate phosphoribosyltransferase n=1 Tax=Salsipaludibacter albus TaxID=2849650 RepID=UPI001EE448AA|nr:orotate phosphoribosyltransferase [Salsipaludibacter albus]MBY5164028.1 orotate phosphoribosyltransferase [Salsipaludibacter albus]
MDTADFVDFLLEHDVLAFGDFTTKSGRATPYFLNFGNLGTGAQIDTVGRAYADHVVATFGDDVDVLFGPAYKGIPLAVATAVSLQRDHGLDVAWTFDRKEAKDHGEGGSLVGHVPTDGQRVVIVEDVTTAGTSIRETVPKLRAVADVDVVGLVVSVDRRERGTRDDVTALDEVAEEFGLRATAITDIDRVVEVLTAPGRDVLSADDLDRLAAYRDRWGVS